MELRVEGKRSTPHDLIINPLLSSGNTLGAYITFMTGGVDAS